MMMYERYIITLLFVIAGTICYGQNLIPNSGFDSLINCPSDYSQIHLAYPWVSSGHTPDLFNDCSTNPDLKVPNAGRQFDSYQPPRSGNGYSGIYVFNETNVRGRELLGVPLKESLEKGELYYIRFYVSLDLTPIMLYWVYTDAIALAFTDSPYYIEIEPDPEFRVPLTPAIENRGTTITDTVGWAKIDGCYIAGGTENFAVIGNFRPNSEIIIEEEIDIYGSASYFYIEDVLVMKFDPLPDTVLLCTNEILSLNAGFLDGKYLWNNGVTDSILEVNSGGVYTVEVIMDKCIMRDTAVVIDMRKTENHGKLDTTICDDELLSLSSYVYGNYQWSGGESSPSIIVNEAGIYALTITNGCGEYQMDVSVDEKMCTCNIYIPNIFSPNDDGVNDYIKGEVACEFEFIMDDFRVFDRWGNQVYEVSQFESINWNGTFRGAKVKDGVYVWMMKYKVIRNNKVEQKYISGDITIIR